MPPNQWAVVRGVVVADDERVASSSRGMSLLGGGGLIAGDAGGRSFTAAGTPAVAEGGAIAGAAELRSTVLTGAIVGGGVGAALVRLPLFSRRLPLF
jgi:hypothetical protein